MYRLKHLNSMKKNLIICIFTMLAATAGAQVKFGAKAGINFSVLTNGHIDYAIKNKTGFFVGPTMKLQVPVKGLGFDAALLYDERRGEVEPIGLAGGRIYWTTIKRQQIAIPINVRYDIALGRHVGIFVFGGPQVGFNVGGSEPTDTSYGSWEPKAANLSLNAGFGFMILNHLQLSANYNYVCTKDADISINRDNSSYKIIDSGKINAWQLSLGYYF